MMIPHVPQLPNSLSLSVSLCLCLSLDLQIPGNVQLNIQQATYSLNFIIPSNCMIKKFRS